MAELQTLDHAGTSCEELAYLLLEEARLRCGALLARDAGTEEGSRIRDELSLHGLYGDLGIAGYHASARLEAGRRRQLLDQARARSRRGGVFSLRVLAEVTAAATRTVERALTVAGLLDHMHLAHIHVLSACETLEAMYALDA